MYSPSAFVISDPAAIRAFLRQHSFGILISRGEGGFEDTHTPLLVSEDMGTISGHIARANPQWHAWAANPAVKVIFHGPHAYVSPRYYVSDFNVPTWNYSAVSVDGRVEIVEDPEASLRIIQELIAAYEGPAGWQLDLTDSRYRKLLDAVVCFTIAVEKIDAKFKLNQNKSAEDRRSVISHLLESPAAGDRDTARLMQSLEEGSADVSH